MKRFLKIILFPFFFLYLFAVNWYLRKVLVKDGFDVKDILEITWEDYWESF